MSRTAIGAYPSTPRTDGGKNFGYAEALLGYFVIAAGAGIVAPAFVGLILADLLISLRLVLIVVGCEEFLGQRDNRRSAGLSRL
jgi:hypothetical protein